MTGPFKMKGSPMQRNFGIGSPMRDEKKEKKEKGKVTGYKTNVYTGEISEEYDDSRLILKEGDDTLSPTYRESHGDNPRTKGNRGQWKRSDKTGRLYKAGSTTEFRD
tara:strand:+ start:1400 stop:1720 length:321 start_codon:yes stop_codon:yes gene_type:complete